MKKLLLILAIGAFVACNDNSGTDELPQDTIPAPVAPMDTTTVAPLDSTVVTVDSTVAQ